MNSKSNIITSIFLLVAGILLIILHDRVNIIGGIVTIVGLLFILPSLYNLIILFIRATDSKKNSNAKTAGVISSIGALCLGICMVAVPDFFVSALVYLFAGLLVIGGLYQILLIAYATKPLRAPWWMYLLPSLAAIAGIVLLVTDVHTIENMVVLITGISFTAVALNSLLVYIGVRSVTPPTESDQVAER